MNKYVVMCDAVILTVGKKSNGKPQYARVLRGGTINGTEANNTIQNLVRRGSIVQAHSKSEVTELGHLSKRQTAAAAARAAGAPDDPALEPNKDFAPFAAQAQAQAQMPDAHPDAILAETE